MPAKSAHQAHPTAITTCSLTSRSDSTHRPTSMSKVMERAGDTSAWTRTMDSEHINWLDGSTRFSADPTQLGLVASLVLAPLGLDLAELHVLEALTALERSSTTGDRIDLTTTTERPAPWPSG